MCLILWLDHAAETSYFIDNLMLHGKKMCVHFILQRTQEGIELPKELGHTLIFVQMA